MYLGIHSHHMYTIHMSCIQDAFIYLFSINSTMILCKFIAVSVFIIELEGLEENHIIHCTLFIINLYIIGKDSIYYEVIS